MSANRLSFPYGDDANVCVHVVDGDGEPVDIGQASEITFTIWRSMLDSLPPVGIPVFQGTLTDADITILQPAEDGIFQVAIPRANSALMMVAKAYYWTAKTTSDSNLIGTPVYGQIYAESPIQR